MGKEKVKGVQNKHYLHARISFLQQAAQYLTTQDKPQPDSNGVSADSGSENLPSEPNIEDDQRNEAESSELTRSVARMEVDNSPSEQAFVLPPSGGLPLLLSSHLAQVARKSQIRLHTDIKHQICKRCSTVLIEGKTCKKSIENSSKGGKKPHADVLVLKCASCGAQKRRPFRAKRQRKKGERKRESGAELSAIDRSKSLENQT